MKNLELIKYVINENRKMKKKIMLLEKIILEMSNFKDVLSVNDVCRNFGISRKTFDRLRRDGLKVSQPKRNGKIFVRKIEIEKFLNKRKYGR